MSDANATPPSESAASEQLWVVDVVAPLPSGRVRVVAADAAARLSLPAEKLVSLLENRIGPVTKPLPRASADRVAEVLHASGAEVETRAARASDGPPSPARAASGAPAPRGAEEPAGGDAVPPSEQPSAAPTGRAEDRQDGARGPRAAEPSGAAGRRPTGATEPAAHDRPPENVAGRQAPRENLPQERHVDEGGPEQRPGEASEPAPRSSPRSPTPTPPSRAPAASPSPDPQATSGERRSRGSLDPWQAMGESAREQDEDEAMLGRWRPMPTRSGTGAPGTRGTTDVPGRPGVAGAPDAAGYALRDAARSGTAEPGAGPGAEPAADGDTPTPDGPAERGPGRPSPAAAPAAADDETSRGVRVTPVEGVSGTAVGRMPGTKGTGVRVPERGQAFEDEGDEAETLGYGMRDPFAEAERHDRAVRRWVLAGSLLLAALLFLVLQWAYSESEIRGLVPPPPHETETQLLHASAHEPMAVARPAVAGAVQRLDPDSE